MRLSTMSFTPGTYTFVAVDDGKIPHSVEIDGPGVHAVTATLSSGQSGRVTVSLRAGRYDVFCPIPGHKALGMNTEITVSGSAAAGGTATTGSG